MIDKNEQLSKKNNELTDFQRLMLLGPVLSQEDLRFIAEKKLHFKQWK